MLKELCEYLVGLGKSANTLGSYRPPQEPEHRYWLTKDGQEITWEEADPRPRAHTALDLDTVVRFARTFSGEGQRVAVWYSRLGVTALLDDETRRDRVSCPLEVSPQVRVLLALEGKSGPQWLDQREMVRLLRVTLWPGVTPPTVEAFRRLRFRQLAQGEREVQHGKASLGKSIESELTGTGSLPETLSLYLPVLVGSPTRQFIIECAVEVNPEAEKLALVPLPGSIEQAIRQAEDVLGADLREALNEEDNAHVYYGSP